MKRYRSAILFLLCAIAFAIPAVVNAHSGGTDSNGGHYNHSTGEYHYHHGYGPHDHYDMNGDGVDDCPYTFTGSSSNSYTSSAENTSDGWYSEDELRMIISLAYEEGHADGYNKGVDAGYENGYDEGYEISTKELTEKYEEILEESKENQKIIILSICGIFIFIVSPIIVSFASSSVNKANKARVQTYIDENIKLKKQLQSKNDVRQIASPPKQFNSSVIKDLIYDDQTLIITLTTGSTYHYQNVPKSVYEEMLKARSIGQFYNYKIKDKYPYY